MAGAGWAQPDRSGLDELLDALSIAASGSLSSHRACMLLHGTALGIGYCETSDVDVVVCADRGVLDSPAARRFYAYAERLGSVSLWRVDVDGADLRAPGTPLPLLFALSRARLLWGSPSVWAAVHRDYLHALRSLPAPVLVALWRADRVRGPAGRLAARPTRDEVKRSRGGALDSQFLRIARQHRRLTRESHASGRPALHAVAHAFRQTSRDLAETVLDRTLHRLLASIPARKSIGPLTAAAARLCVRMNARCVEATARDLSWTSSSTSS